MPDPILDAIVYRELQETVGADFAAELACTFLEEAPQMLEAARQAFAADDAVAFARAAHSLKSNALTFGAARLGAMARTLELGTLAQADAAALDALDAACAEAALALQAMRHV